MKLGAYFSGGLVAGFAAAGKALTLDGNRDGKGARTLGATWFIANRAAHAAIGTAGNVTYTAANLATGKIVRATAGATRTDTFDSAANLVAAVPRASVGDEIRCLIINDASAAEAIQLAVPASGSFAAVNNTKQIPQNGRAEVIIRFTNVTPGAESYVVY